MVRSACLILVMVALVGCATSSGILPSGPNTYTVAEHYSLIRGGGAAAQVEALKEANAYCAQQERQLLVSIDMPTAYGRDYSLTFRCLLPGDPALTR